MLTCSKRLQHQSSWTADPWLKGFQRSGCGRPASFGSFGEEGGLGLSVTAGQSSLLWLQQHALQFCSAVSETQLRIFLERR